ncbi:hypothetical protein JW698_02165 [Candidatus Wolfebacteria bacterium]|nr:hypothetical protein [Candidatus Wolfebacteria bacterium]
MNKFFKKIVQFFLKWFAKIYIWRIKPHIIVIAGTTNRHWIKEAVAITLKEKNFQTRMNKKNFNAEIGLPLSILGINSDENNFWHWFKIIFQAAKKAFRSKPPILNEFLVLEMAIDRPKGIKYLLSIVKPKTLILTTVTMIYAENFDTLDKIALEYKRLIKSLYRHGLAILNFDDERIKSLAEFSENRVISYGFSKEADFQVKGVKKTTNGQELKIQLYPSRQIRLVKINRFGEHHIYAALVKEIIRENFRISAPDFFQQMRG